MGDRMMDGMGPMMWGMGLFGLLALILLALAVAAVTKCGLSRHYGRSSDE